MALKGPKGTEQERRLALAQVQRGLASLPAKKRMDAIIDSPESRALVRSMPLQDLYATIIDVGLADSTELVQMASPEQFQGFLDLSVWNKDRMDPRGILVWLRAARGDEDQDYLAKLRKMDLEILELVLREYVRMHDLEENPDVALSGVPFETPEGKYLLELMGEGVELAAVRQLVTDLIAENPFEAVRLFEAVRWELPTELEHTAHQFRAARLQDLGFPDANVAHALFSFVKPPAVQLVHAIAPRESLVAYQRVDYFAAAMSLLEANELENLGAELREIANAALVAEASEPGDLDAARAVGEMVKDTLSLGLEHLTGGDSTRAADVVRDVELRRIFQIGFSLTLQLKFRADRLAKRPLARLGGKWLLFEEEKAGVEAIRAPRPRRALRVEGAEPVPYRARSELRDTEALLERAEHQNAILVGLLGGKPDDALSALELPDEQLDAEAIFTAALVNAALDGRPLVAAVPASRLGELGPRLIEAAGDEVVVHPDARARARDVLGAGVSAEARPELERLVDKVLERIARELGRSLLRDPDPRAVAALIPLAIR